MKHFYGTVKGMGTTQATRYGTRASGLQTHARTRDGEIQVELSYNEKYGKDQYVVTLEFYDKRAMKKIKLAQGFI